MLIKQFDITHKQKLALNYLADDTTTELFYGGAAGGGKSFLGCLWLLQSCLKYPGSRWLMGRAILKSLKESTLLTFFGVCADAGLKAKEHYTYNSMSNKITFYNGSEIYLKDLFLYPSDPQFDTLGSTEFTGAFIDECSQVTLKAKNIVMSRIRFKLEEFKVIPKLLLASNPAKNFLYYDFYQPNKVGTLVDFRKFIPALVQDNPFISPHYIENLKKLDKVSKERLLYGNFEYDDDPSKLFEYDDIIAIFRNRDFSENKFQRYISVDVARFGKDKTVIYCWKDYHVYKVITIPVCTTKEIVEKINKLMISEDVPVNHVVIDEDGVGGGVVDYLPGCKGFVNNSSPIDVTKTPDGKTPKYEVNKLNYKNLKAQCYFELSNKISRVSVYEQVDVEVKKLLIEDLEQIKRKDIDKDSKVAILSKEEIKERLGRSTDYSDALMMRMVFEFGKEFKFFFA